MPTGSIIEKLAAKASSSKIRLKAQSGGRNSLAFDVLVNKVFRFQDLPRRLFQMLIPAVAAAGFKILINKKISNFGIADDLLIFNNILTQVGLDLRSDEFA